MKNRLTTISATFFYLGYSPFAPGTAGTLGAIPLYLVLISFLTPVQYAAVTVLLIIFGIFISFKAIGIFNNNDPKEVVIDEVVGYLVAMAFLTPTALNIVLCFFLFRFFDIVKPFPARQLERMRGGYGVVLDDVAAGIWTNIVLLALNYYVIK